MNDAIDLAPTIGAEAQLPQSSSADGQSASARPLADLIAADQYVNTKAALASTRRGPLGVLRMTRLLTPGAGPARRGGGFDSAGYLDGF